MPSISDSQVGRGDRVTFNVFTQDCLSLSLLHFDKQRCTMRFTLQDNLPRPPCVTPAGLVIQGVRSSRFMYGEAPQAWWASAPPTPDSSNSASKTNQLSVALGCP